MSQVDASIGGKTSINFREIKNKLGVINNPTFILILPVFLRTLSKNEIISGYGEIFKYALIKDEGMWGKLQKNTLELTIDIEELILYNNLLFC